MHDRAASAAMRAWRRDSTLPLPPATPRATRSLPFDLATTLPAVPARAPFVVRGQDAVAASRVDGAGIDLRCDGVRAAARLRIRDAAVHATRVTTLGVVRTLHVGGREIAERIFVPAAGPAVVIEWSDAAQPDAPPPLELDVEWEVPGTLAGRAAAEGGASEPRWNDSAKSVVAESGGGAIAFGVPDAVALRAEPREDGSLRCLAAVVSSDGPVRLLVAAARTGAGDAVAALARAADAAALARARAARLRRSARDRLSVRTGDPAIDRALEWAMIRLAEDAGRLATLPPSDDAAVLRSTVVALASLGAGDALPAERLLAGWADTADPSPRLAALLLLLAAWHGRWTGDAAAFAAHLPAARRAAVALGRGGTDPLAAAALSEIARAAEAAAPAFAAEARAGLAALSADGPHVHAGRGLATLGTASAPGKAAAPVEADPWAALLDAIEALPGAASAATAAWRALVTGPADGLVRWRERLLSGLERQNALWDHDLDPALLILAWVHAALGAAPDASRHRLLLRPFAPAGWPSWAVDGLRVADTRVGAAFERHDGRLVFRADQSAGAFPLTLILELVVPETAIAAVRVDGRPAALDLRRDGDRLIVPVQLVLDDRRVVELVFHGAEASDKKAAPGERGRQ